MKLSNLPFKFESELVRAWYRWTGGHPVSSPYITGDGFRALADWRYEPATSASFDPTSVRPGSLGFCDGWVLQEFLKRIGPQITVSFRLISHNADPNVTSEVAELLPESLTVLYTMNCLVDHPQIIALPIGLENARFHYNGVASDFERLRKCSVEKKPRILMAFTVGTNTPLRKPAWDALVGLDTVDTLSRINSRTYRKIAHGYSFIVSPPGNGEDCHRTWEALYLGAVPIVLRSSMTEGFARKGLPLWMVDSYDELKGFDEKALAERYRSLAPGLDSPWLWMDSWKALLGAGQR